MSIQQQIKHWSSTHNPQWLTIVRIVLGLCLFLKGFVFIQNTSILQQYLSETSIASNSSWLTTAIPWIHLLGGFMIIIGLFTRFSSLIQIPILLGAVFFVNAKRGVFSGESDLLFSIIILVLLVVFLLEGSGKISLDNYFAGSKDE